MSKSHTLRYTQPLPVTDCDRSEFTFDWDSLATVTPDECEELFLKILNRHGFGQIKIFIPLKSRYTRGRKWTQREFDQCFNAWKQGHSLTLIAATLNRNPQDMIYRLLDHCHKIGIEFTEKGRSEGSERWTDAVANCAVELFENGLPAWKIAALFKVDFEHVEKQLFTKRKDYGHKKKNPFAINTEHKYFVNRQVLSSKLVSVTDALDAFAGEGKSTAIIQDVFPESRIVAIEIDPSTSRNVKSSESLKKVDWITADNLEILPLLVEKNEQFNLIDLDPFVTCHQQLEFVWPLLRSPAQLFLTFGGEYRRSFIKSNRKAICSRYGFRNDSLSNRDYLEIVPFYFLGWVAQQAASNGFCFSVIRAVRYANNCRFWLTVENIGESKAQTWLNERVAHDFGGCRFKDVKIPRFSEVRDELHTHNQLKLF